MHLKTLAAQIKAVFFDIDGTLVPRESNLLSSETRDALHRLKKRGIKVCLASGRSPGALEEVEKLFPFDGSIAVNGQYCTLPKGEMIHKNAFSLEQAQCMLAFLQRHRLACIFASPEGNRINFSNERMANNCRSIGSPIPSVLDENWLLEEDILQFMVFAEESWDRPIEEALPFLRCVRAIEPCVDVYPKNGGKLRGIEAFARHFGFGLESCMAFGDGYNDLEMLEGCGLGIAMGDAPPEVKSAANGITETVEGNGIPLALERCGLL